MTKKSKFADPLALAVASGSTIAAAAEAAGCATSTAYNLTSDPAFRLRVAELRSEATFQAVGKLAAAAAEAVDTLRELLAATNEPGIRLNASKAILNAVGPLTDQFEIRARLDAIEQSALRVHHGA